MTLDRMAETIVAPITAIGGAVALVRLSGVRSWAIASSVFSAWPDVVVPRVVTYGWFREIDDGYVLPFSADRSFTGEESVELSVHGSSASVGSLVSACIEAGARMAEPGEFTLRAFLNGRVDLTEAEGVRDAVAARTLAQLRQANSLRTGRLKNLVHEIRDRLVTALVAVEAATDFSEEVGDVDRTAVDALCSSALEGCRRLLSHGGTSRIVRQGLSVAIVGLPNAGKSSLFNALVGADRAIVTAIPGTTRDTVEESVAWHGRLVRLIDTAGIRDSENEIEALGIDRSRSALESADLVLYVYDASAGWGTDDDGLHASVSRPVVVVANKCDLVASADRGVAVSATRGTGLDSIVEEALDRFKWDDDDEAVLNERHGPILLRVVASVEHARQTLAGPVPDDLAAVDLRAAINCLGEVTGETATVDVIERIFSDFCIGK